jgi:hypothetical protein
MAQMAHSHLHHALVSFHERLALQTNASELHQMPHA